MTETRLGRQTPTQSVTIPYSKTRGQEAAELYAKTGNEPGNGRTKGMGRRYSAEHAGKQSRYV